jgi:hypothetical protein
MSQGAIEKPMRINKNSIVKVFARLFGMEAYKPGKFPMDYDARAVEIIKAVTPYTMIGMDRLYALITAVRHITQHNIQGAIVECGVWRGGAMGAAALALRCRGKPPTLSL